MKLIFKPTNLKLPLKKGDAIKIVWKNAKNEDCEMIGEVAYDTEVNKTASIKVKRWIEKGDYKENMINLMVVIDLTDTVYLLTKEEYMLEML